MGDGSHLSKNNGKVNLVPDSHRLTHHMLPPSFQHLPPSFQHLPPSFQHLPPSSGPFFRHSGEGRKPQEILDKEPPNEGTSQLYYLNTVWCSVYVCFLLYERSSWIPACAGMTNRENRNDELNEIRQTGFEMRDLPVLNHCFIKKAVREMDYFGQRWVMGITKHALVVPITPHP